MELEVTGSAKRVQDPPIGSKSYSSIRYRAQSYRNEPRSKTIWKAMEPIEKMYRRIMQQPPHHGAQEDHRQASQPASRGREPSERLVDKGEIIMHQGTELKALLVEVARKMKAIEGMQPARYAPHMDQNIRPTLPKLLPTHLQALSDSPMEMLHRQTPYSANTAGSRSRSRTEPEAEAAERHNWNPQAQPAEPEAICKAHIT